MVTVFNVSVVEHTCVILVGLKVLQIIRGTRGDDVVSDHYCSTLDNSIALQKFKVWQVQVFHMLDEDHVIGTILFKEVWRITHCCQVYLNHMVHSCVLVNPGCNTCEMLVHFHCNDFSPLHTFELIGENQSWVAAVSSNLENFSYWIFLHDGLHDVTLLWAKIHHPILFTKVINFGDDIFGVSFLTVVKDVLTQFFLNSRGVAQWNIEWWIWWGSPEFLALRIVLVLHWKRDISLNNLSDKYLYNLIENPPLNSQQILTEI